MSLSCETRQYESPNPIAKELKCREMALKLPKLLKVPCKFASPVNFSRALNFFLFCFTFFLDMKDTPTEVSCVCEQSALPLNLVSDTFFRGLQKWRGTSSENIYAIGVT